MKDAKSLYKSQVDAERVSLTYWRSGFLKLYILTTSALMKHVPHHCEHFVEVDHSSFSLFLIY